MPTSNPLSRQIYQAARRWWPLLLIVLFVADVALVYTFQTSRRVSAGDFFVPWYATREMVFYHRDPYSTEVTSHIQIAMSGQVFGPEVEDQLSFNYPLYFSLYLLPLIPFDYPLAEAIWNVITQFAMVGAVWMFLRLIGWQAKSPVYRLIPYLCAFLCYPFLYTIAYGQYTIVTLFFITTGAWLLQRQHHLWGGVITALAVFKPQTGMLVVACLLFWCLITWKRRYPALLSAAAVGLALLCLPMLWQVDWLLRWLDQAGYRRLHPGMYSYNEEIIHQLGLSWSSAITVANFITGLMGLGLLWLWIRDRHSAARFPILLGLTGLLTLAILPQYGHCNDIIFYPAALLLLQWLRQRVNQRTFMLLSLGGAISSFVPLLLSPPLVHSTLVVIGLSWLGWEMRRKPTELAAAPEKTPDNALA
jgi:hypothetical protein